MNRYELHELLGRGGMACVYRATDRTSGREVALKQLMLDPLASRQDQRVALFEREFHLLAQLRHPHVIAVYDYGVDDGQPYYTMELLDGGDLNENAPHPWREVCQLFFQVCSSLALLHSRRLLHRDISPRNIRRTRAGGAKLIDFGALAPMSAGGSMLVGTPAFAAPETVHRLALDASTDLFSLGSTLYYALSGSVPYPARTFAEAIAAWAERVPPPSVHVPGIPAALDELVMALINIEPALRPQRAFDVMQRLAAIAGLSANEPDAVPRAYLATPSLVGRDETLDSLRQKLLTCAAAKGGGATLSAQPGLGRSRLLDACALEAKTLGYSVLRATASSSREPYAVVRALLKHLLELGPSPALTGQFPELFTLDGAANDLNQLHGVVCELLIAFSADRPLLVAVDDVHRLDPASAALLAMLLDAAAHTKLCVVLTLDNQDAGADALQALVRRCERLTLAALTHEQTARLLSSLFGEVANLAMLATEVHQVALGNPQRTLDIAQHLIDRAVIRYAAGIWTLPPRLSADDLPRNAMAAMRARIAHLSPLARLLGEAHALAFYEALTLTDYRQLAGSASHAHVDDALLALEQMQALVRDGAGYVLANRLWIEAFGGQLSEAERRARHAALADMYRDVPMAVIHHCFSAGLEQRGLDKLLSRYTKLDQATDHVALMEQNVTKMTWCQMPAIEAAIRLGHSRRQVHEQRRWYYTAVITHEEPVDTVSRDVWLAQLVQDSGLAAYRSDVESATPHDRLMWALQSTVQSHQARPEAEQVYTVEEGIRRLAEYVAVSVAIGGRGHDMDLLRSLPAMLEPFLALSPALVPIFVNASATCCSIVNAQFDQARVHWIDALEKLDQLSERELMHVAAMRAAVAYALAMCEAQLGLPTATRWAERLERDPSQRVGALHLRKVICLQQGDWTTAAELQRQVEILALQTRTPPMFRELLVVELGIYAKARDLSGAQQVLEQIKVLAGRYPGWLPSYLVGDAQVRAIAGDYSAACQQFERCIALTQPDATAASTGMPAWVAACAGLSEALIMLQRPAEARERASAALRVCEAQDIGCLAFDLSRALALAEAKLADARGVARLDALIAQQVENGVVGLQLGASYEARAQIALWQRDVVGFEHFARLTASEYRHSARSPLGARYEALMNQAARHGLLTTQPLADFGRSHVRSDSPTLANDMLSGMWRSLLQTTHASARAEAALELVCAASAVRDAHLYVVSSQGLKRTATYGDSAVAPALDLMQRYLDEALNQHEDVSDAVTREMVQLDDAAHELQVADTTYAAWLLSCRQGTVRHVVGVVVLARVQGAQTPTPDPQLLCALAEHFIRVGDSAGIALRIF